MYIYIYMTSRHIDDSRIESLSIFFLRTVCIYHRYDDDYGEKLIDVMK